MPDDSPDVRVLFFDPYFGITNPATPIERILKELDQEELDVDVIVLRSVSRGLLLAQLLDDRSLIELLERQSERTNIEIALLNQNPETADMELDWIRLPARLGKDVLPLLRELEFAAQLQRSGAIYRSSSGHFVLPSGAHADTFIRIADAFDDVAVIKRLAEWFENFLQPGTVLIGDTWTLSPLLQELQYRGMQRFHGATIPIVTFNSYPTIEIVRNTFSRVAAIFDELETGSVLAFLSVESSGTLLSTWQELTHEQLGNVSSTIVTLVSTGEPTPDTVKIASAYGIERYASSDVCRLCNDSRKSPLISIDDKRYFPTIDVQVDVQMVVHKTARKHAKFWETASKMDAVRVHADDFSTGRQRHLHIDIDVSRMLDDPGFADVVADDLAKNCNRCDVLFVPKHPATPSLIKLARAIYPSPEIIEFPRSVLDRVNKEDQITRGQLAESLKRAKNILILDDAIIGGHTIRSLHRLIQDVIHDLPSQVAPHDYTIRAYGIVGRPTSTLRWEGLQASLRGNGGTELYCFEHMLVPGFPCPWCDEAKLLEKILRHHGQQGIATGQTKEITGEAISVLRRRYDMLTPIAGGRIRGLGSSLFLCGPAANMGDRAAEYLSQGSFFGERLNEAVAYAAMAVAMHELREISDQESRQLNGKSWVWNIPKIMDAYHDPLLHVAFVRAARSRELLFPNTDALRSAFEDVMFSNPSTLVRQHAAVAAEQKFALLSGKYPKLNAAIFTEYIDPVLNDWNLESAVFLEAIESALSVKAEL